MSADERLAITDIEERVVRACKTLRALPDPDRRFLNNGNPMGQNWQVVQEYIDAYGSEDLKPRFHPTREDVSDYLIALAWCRVLSRKEFKLIWWRSFDVSFMTIGGRIGRSDETARNRYREAIVKIWGEAMAEKWKRAS